MLTGTNSLREKRSERFKKRNFGGGEIFTNDSKILHGIAAACGKMIL
jgi:hypothetical protein